ncbi:hypothetical protein LZ023_05355 [Pseudomonas silvicola]|nr:hypothetical protein LZ023_05355 [Pseudomonas silvicola]
MRIPAQNWCDCDRSSGFIEYTEMIGDFGGTIAAWAWLLPGRELRPNANICFAGGMDLFCTFVLETLNLPTAKEAP